MTGEILNNSCDQQQIILPNQCHIANAKELHLFLTRKIKDAVTVETFCDYLQKGIHIGYKDFKHDLLFDIYEQNCKTAEDFVIAMENIKSRSMFAQENGRIFYTRFDIDTSFEDIVYRIKQFELKGEVVVKLRGKKEYVEAVNHIYRTGTRKLNALVLR